eukprot:365040-Chlamydomonas_euryale.AAC.17
MQAHGTSTTYVWPIARNPKLSDFLRSHAVILPAWPPQGSEFSAPTVWWGCLYPWSFACFSKHPPVLRDPCAPADAHESRETHVPRLMRKVRASGAFQATPT